MIDRTAADGALARSRRWAVRRIVRDTVLVLGFLTAVVVGFVGWRRTEDWRKDLLRSGARTTGRVVAVRDRTGRSGPAVEALIEASEPPLRFFVDGDPDEIIEGQVVTVYYDPRNHGHARIDAGTPQLAGRTVAALFGGAVGFLLSALDLRSKRRLRSALVADLHPTTITERPGPVIRRPKDRPRRYRFADTGDDVWLVAARDRVAAGDDVFTSIGATARTRVVVWPDRARPVQMWREPEPPNPDAAPRGRRRRAAR